MVSLHLVLSRLAHNEAPGSLSSGLLLQFLVGIVAKFAVPLALFVALKALVLVVGITLLAIVVVVICV